MGLSDADVQKQLTHMMKFIEQEATEKADEIDAKAEEEFNIEKGRLVQQQRTKIMEYYEKKEKQVELQRKIQSSNMLNQARLRVLKARGENIEKVLEEARGRLAAESSNNQARYAELLKGLITEGLFQLLEDKVVLRCRQQDVGLIERLLPDCLAHMKASAGEGRYSAAGAVTVDKSTFLPPDSAGGVELRAKDGKIRLLSTLESRLDLISGQMVPEVRTSLFGRNPNRKFLD